MKGVMGILITISLQIYQGIFQWNFFKSVKMWQNYSRVSLAPLFGLLCRVPKIRCQCVWLSDCKKLESICIIVYRGKACIRVNFSIVIVCIYSYIHSWTRGVSCRDVIIWRQQWQFSQHCALQPIVVVTDCSITESLLPLNARQFVCRFRCMPCQRRWRLISPFWSINH